MPFISADQVIPVSSPFLHGIPERKPVYGILSTFDGEGPSLWPIDRFQILIESISLDLNLKVSKPPLTSSRSLSDGVVPHTLAS